MAEEFLKKPRYGQPCNGCGLCCMLEVCALGVVKHGFGVQGPCPSLVRIGNQYRCEIIINEQDHIEGHNMKGLKIMTDTKPTPGPYHISKSSNGPIAVQSSSNEVIARCFGKNKSANARLIAAAPETAAERDRLKAINAELLEALSQMLARSECAVSTAREYAKNGWNSDADNAWADEQEFFNNLARAAIAKARKIS